MIDYITIGLILFAFESAYLMLASRLRIVDRPHHQSSHTGEIIRGGGIDFYLAFLFWSLLNGIPSIGGLIGVSLLAIISFVDDIHSVNPKIRLICHFLAILMLFYHSGLIRSAPHVVIILSIACVTALNIYNFMDGINGLTGGYSLVVALALLYVNENMVAFVDSDLIIYTILALVIFNFYNFRRKAVCFAGDVGSLSIGFILVFLILRLALKAHSMAWIVFLAVYMVDGGMTILHRILLRENLMKPHKKHVYQIMANELKMPHLVVSGIYMGLQAICCASFIAWPNYWTFCIIIGAMVLFYLLFMKRYYRLHVK